MVLPRNAARELRHCLLRRYLGHVAFFTDKMKLILLERLADGPTDGKPYVCDKKIASEATNVLGDLVHPFFVLAKVLIQFELLVSSAPLSLFDKKSQIHFFKPKFKN